MRSVASYYGDIELQGDYNSEKRKLPSAKEIKTYWEDYFVQIGKFDSPEEYWEDDYCFACGMRYQHTLERAHILPRNSGGSDKASNLHLLCQNCHKQSEFVSGPGYFAWLEKWSFYDTLLRNLIGAVGPDFIPDGDVMEQLPKLLRATKYSCFRL